MVSLRRFGRQSLTYGLIGALGRFAGLILLPVYTRAMSEAEFGAYALSLSFLAVVGLLADFGMSSAVLRFAPSRDGASYISFAGRTLVISTAVMGGGVFLLAGPVSQLLSGGNELAQLLRIGGLFVWLSGVTSYLRSVFRAEERSLAFGALSLGRALTVVVAGVMLVAVLDLGAPGAMWAEVVGYAVPLIIALPTIYRRVARSVTAGVRGTLMRYALPLAPAALSYWLVDQVDRLLLARLDSLDAVGEYAAAVRIAQIMLVAVWGVQIAWPPAAFAAAEEDEEMARVFYRRVARLYAAIFLTLAVAMGIYARWLTSVLATAEYLKVAPAVPLLALGAVGFGYYYIFSIGTHIGLRTAWIAPLGFVAAAINVGLNLVAIPRWGPVGAAGTTLITYLLLASMMLLLSQRAFPVHYTLMRIAGGFVLAGLAIVIGYDIPGTALGMLLARPAVILAFAAGTVALGLVERRELATAVSVVGSLLKRARA